jgi:hypothetical protein
VSEAMVFIQDISKIKAPIYKNGDSYSQGGVVTKKVLRRWRTWYYKNRSQIIWSEENNKPVLK